MKQSTKMRRYAEGGGVREGRNENIDDDTRARAMKFVEDGKVPEKAAAKPAAKAAPAKAKEAPLPPKGVGPTVERAAEMRAKNMPKGDWYEPVTKNEDEANKYRDRAIGAATAAATLAAGPVGGAVSRALAGKAATKAAETAGRSVATRGFDKITPIPNRAGPRATEALPAPKGGPALEGPKGGPALSGPKGAARVEAEPTKAALPAPKAAEPVVKAKPKAKAKMKEKAPAPKASTKSPTRKFNEDEAGVEFKRGGKVRGSGLARHKQFKVR
jgi:hypothetical protein